MRSDEYGRCAVSIVRVGLAETKKFSEGYEAIFGKKKAAAAEAEPAEPKPAKAKAKKAAPRKKATPKKNAAKK
jgi:hypothetical protein